MTIPNANRSAGQDGVLGMAFDPRFKNTYHIYVAYRYDADPGEEVDRHIKITSDMTMLPTPLASRWILSTDSLEAVTIILAA
jgi:hypothetical protein